MQSFHVGFEKAPDWFDQMLEGAKAVDVSLGPCVGYTVSTTHRGILKAVKGDIVWKSMCGSVGVQQNNVSHLYN